MTDRIKEAITEWFGPRCDESEPGCPACDAWAEFDFLLGERDEALKYAETIKATARRVCEIRDKYRSERDALKEYAIAATKALTGCTVGGSEFFAGQKLGFYKADIAACVKNIEWRKDQAMKVGEARGRSEGNAQLAEARNTALEEAAIKGPIPCYETRHVTLGDKVKDAIRALKEETP